ncbi:MAG: metal ABC transporter permease [Actinobacteria bacterium]|nr:metal ABC transporter permease [Actinomycetota bacterium]
MGALVDLLPLPYADAVVALGAAILGLTAGVLGAFAVFRGRSLVGDALSHCTLPGVAIAFLVTGAKDAGTLLVGAGIAGLLGALCMVGIERTTRIRPDAAIGVVLTGSFSLGIVLLTFIAASGDANQAGLDAYLFGQAAGLVERDLVIMGVLALVSLGLVGVGFRALKATLFDPGFAASVGLPVRALEVAMTVLVVVAVVIGIRAVGAILMVAMLVSPTVAARQLTSRLSLVLVLAGGIGAGVGVTGALLATRTQLPTGPVIVLVGFAVVLACVLAAPGRGVLWCRRRLGADRRWARNEAVLVELDRSRRAGHHPTEVELASSSARPRRETARALADLDRRGLLVRVGAVVSLSTAGVRAARDAVERRELWSLWLEHGAQLDLPDAREPDPRDVQRSLGREQVARLHALAAAGQGR